MFFNREFAILFFFRHSQRIKQIQCIDVMLKRSKIPFNAFDHWQSIRVEYVGKRKSHSKRKNDARWLFSDSIERSLTMTDRVNIVRKLVELNHRRNTPIFIRLLRRRIFHSEVIMIRILMMTSMKSRMNYAWKSINGLVIGKISYPWRNISIITKIKNSHFDTMD